MKYPEIIKMIRTKVGLSQEEFGKKIGSSQITVSTYELGTRTPPLKKVKTIIKFAREHKIKVKLEDFLNGDD